MLRHAIVGVGAGVLKLHRPALRSDAVELVGVSDLNADVGRRRADELGCSFYADHRAMLAEARPDVAVVLTPHPFHAPIAIDALEAGCHVLVEKPMAVHVGEADAMIAASERAKRLLAVVFQYRHRPEVRLARELVRSGRLGTVQRVDLVGTWTRTAAYYATAPWRGTWAGEGGGVLMNQAPHHLDMLCFIMGPPARLVARTGTTLHAIETEDTALALLEWPDGALGTLRVSTAEAGEPERLEIVGTGGRLRLGLDTLALEAFEPDLREHIATSPELYVGPPLRPVPLELDPAGADHTAVYQDFHRAILGGAPPTSDGAEGRTSLELANAITYSGRTGRWADLPLDRAAYAALLDELRTR